MKKQRVLALVDETLVPPDDPAGHDVVNAPWKMEFDVVHTLREKGHEVLAAGVGSELGVIRRAIQDLKPDIAFNLLESFADVATWDLNVVAYLELMRVAYTGCNTRGLLLARDKALAKKILTYHRIPVPDFVMVPRGRAVRRPRRLGFPLIVKSLTLDASIGISQASVVENDERLRERVHFIHRSVGTDAIVERYIEGRELYVGIIGNLTLKVFPVWELNLGQLPRESWRIATERVKWSASYQKKHDIMSGPAMDLPPAVVDRIQRLCRRVYRTLDLSGYARIDLRLTEDGRVYVLEANPRASRTVPLVSKVCNISMARIATQLMMGRKLRDLNLKHRAVPHFGVKEAVFPFKMYPEVDPLLGPEMRSTGEVLGLADSFGLAFFKAEEAADQVLPAEGTVLITVSEKDKHAAVEMAREFRKLGFKIKATKGTHKFLTENGIEAEAILKMHEGRPHIVDAIKNKEIDLIINTPSGKLSKHDDSYIRKSAIRYKVPYITTMAASAAAAKGIAAFRQGHGRARSLQSYHGDLK